MAGVQVNDKIWDAEIIVDGQGVRVAGLPYKTESVGVLASSSIVILGLDPRTLHLTVARQVYSPQVKPEGDARWGGRGCCAIHQH